MVDDEPAVRAAVTRALTLDGYEVVAAEDGPAALGAIQRERPELVVLDVLMPELDGVAVCRRLRSDGDRTPILMLTARDAVSDRVSGPAFGHCCDASSTAIPTASFASPTCHSTPRRARSGAATARSS